MSSNVRISSLSCVACGRSASAAAAFSRARCKSEFRNSSVISSSESLEELVPESLSESDSVVESLDSEPGSKIFGGSGNLHERPEVWSLSADHTKVVFIYFY